MKDQEPKDYYEEIDQIEQEGFDTSRFCSAECVLNHCCDFCYYYDFKPGDCGCYLNVGQCDLHGRRDPEDGQDCPDFICCEIKEKQYKKDQHRRLIEKLFLARQGKNICKDCWANLFCPGVEETDVKEDDQSGSI